MASNCPLYDGDTVNWLELVVIKTLIKFKHCSNSSISDAVNNLNPKKM